MPSLRAKVILVFIFSALILPPTHDAINNRLGRYQDVTDVIKFIKENTNEKDFIIYEGWLSPLVIYTGRGFVKPATMVSDQIRQEIQSFGFAETMKKYRIKYFFSPYEEPYYKDFAPLFAKTKFIEPGGKTYNRNLTIFQVTKQEYPGMNEGLQEIDQIEKEYDLPRKFHLTAKIGKYHFYSFRN